MPQRLAVINLVTGQIGRSANAGAAQSSTAASASRQASTVACGGPQKRYALWQSESTAQGASGVDEFAYGSPHAPASGGPSLPAPPGGPPDPVVPAGPVTFVAPAAPVPFVAPAAPVPFVAPAAPVPFVAPAAPVTAANPVEPFAFAEPIPLASSSC